MFGIGLPELILILALALIVVGPDKLPDLARSVAKTLVDLKKTAEGLKDSIQVEDNPLSEIKPELEEAAKNFKDTILDAETKTLKGSDDLASSDSKVDDIYDDYATMLNEGEALAENQQKDDSQKEEENNKPPHNDTTQEQQQKDR